MRRLAAILMPLLCAACGSTEPCHEVVETVYVGYDQSGTYVDGLNDFLSAHPGAECEASGASGHLAAYTCHACD